ncbi:hypothetical protein SAMN05216267_104826 [Actinacidiphila rubida]|uniref:Uncharacterized protein n=1 Tax=Actinacidiphila rubida TaxID=310780 RepID=A0A1H8T6V6_9ACTN|nr:hypothetical protein [Actinacidiphila rubida]SEO86228.1 hypothetical protein SAMN05216267_104826 [Actinacidiphila rubida]
MSRSTILTLATAVLLAAGTAATTATAHAAPLPPPLPVTVPADAPSWAPGSLPATDTVLTGVAQPDAGTTWAAGFRITQSGKVSVHTPVLLTRRAGDPQGWVDAPTAALPDGTRTRFNAVTATSAADGWVVGDDSPEAGGIVAEHWNGTAWTAAAAPVPAATYLDSAGLLSVSGRGAGDTWAVGWAQIEDGTTTGPDGLPSVQTHMEGLAEHWNGSSWTLQRLPQTPGGFTLDAVAEIGPGDVWAGGYTSDDQPLLLHDDGHGWKRVAGPRTGGLAGEFNALAAGGPDDVWAVGRTVRDDTDPGHALVAHWDGRGWQQVAVPEEAGRLSAVTVTPQGDVVAVGRVTTAAFPGPGADGYAMRLSGGTWGSLALPSGTLFDPTGVAVSPLRQTTVVGVVADPAQPEPQPMVLTSGG